jgi:hypothetical protein
MPDRERRAFSFAALLHNRIIRTFAVIAALLAIYVEGATAFVNTQQALQAKAVADNAVLRQKSEGELAAQQAKTALEIARNAAERQHAEADKAEADANKLEAEAITAGETARNAEMKARADADTIKAEAELRKQKYIVALETARNASRRQKAEADSVEAQLAQKRQASDVIARQVDLYDCSKPFQAGDWGEQLLRRSQCGR